MTLRCVSIIFMLLFHAECHTRDGYKRRNYLHSMARSYVCCFFVCCFFSFSCKRNFHGCWVRVTETEIQKRIIFFHQPEIKRCHPIVYLNLANDKQEQQQHHKVSTFFSRNFPRKKSTHSVDVHEAKAHFCHQYLCAQY